MEHLDLVIWLIGWITAINIDELIQFKITKKGHTLITKVFTWIVYITVAAYLA